MRDAECAENSNVSKKYEEEFKELNELFRYKFKLRCVVPNVGSWNRFYVVFFFTTSMRLIHIVTMLRQ